MHFLFARLFSDLERRGALQIDLLSGTGVAEAQRFRMNTHCLAAVCISVYAVSDDGVADGAAVNIELVGASGNAGKAQPGYLLTVNLLAGKDLVLGDGFFGILKDLLANVVGGKADEGSLLLFGGNAHVGGVLVVHHEGHVDDAGVVGHVSLDEGLVLSGDLAGAELGVEIPEGVVGLGEDHEAGGVHAEAVACHLVGVAGFAAEGIKDGLLEGGVAVLAGGGEDAGGLVDDNNVLILMDDLEVLLEGQMGGIGDEKNVRKSSDGYGETVGNFTDKRRLRASNDRVDKHEGPCATASVRPTAASGVHQ